MLEHLDRAAVEAAITRIETLPEEAIRKIVTRMPDEYLPGDQKTMITEGLVGRRPLLGPALVGLGGVGVP